MANGLEAPQADPRGARALFFGGDAKAAAKAGKDVAYQFGATSQPMSADTFLFPADENFNAPAKWSAQPFIDEIKAGGTKMAAGFDNFMQRQGPSMLNAVDSMAQRTGMTQAPWYRPMLEALSQGGLPRLQELVKQGVVPVSALAALGLASLPDHSAGQASAQ